VSQMPKFSLKGANHLNLTTIKDVKDVLAYKLIIRIIL